MMSYTDNANRRVQPGSLIVATLINGGALLGVLLAGPEIAKIVKDKPIIGELIETEIKPIPKTNPERAKTPDHKLIVPQGPPDDATGPIGENTLTSEGGSDAGGFVSPPDPVPDPTPKPFVHNPVLKIARPDPRYAAALQPDYPPSMIRAETEGTVSVRVLIGIDGRVKQVEVTSAASDEFAEATKRQALKKWRFVPGTSDGTPIESWREMTVRFEMPT
jgi:periplasmic protein TonB